MLSSFQQLFTKLVHIANFTLVLPTVGGRELETKKKKARRKERKGLKH